MKSFKGKKVLLLGLGILGGGVGAVKFFLKEGAEVIVTDKRKEEELKPSLKKLINFPIKYVLGRHRKKDILNADLIIRNPAVPQNSPYLKLAKKRGVLVETEMSLFLKNFPGLSIGITGTKGKSTTTTLIYKFLKTKYRSVFIGGIIGKSILPALLKAKKSSLAVLELSSFYLEDIKKSPNIAIILNIFPDHLDRYKNFSSYLKVKENIFKFQKKKDILLLNFSNPYCKKFSQKAKSSLYFFSEKEIKSKKRACFLKEGKIFFGQEKKPLFSLSKIPSKIPLSNILASLSVAKLFKINNLDILKVLKNFKGIEHRLEKVRVLKGVAYINDSSATIPEATIFSLKALKNKKNIILIGGGVDKNLDYKKLAKEIEKRVKKIILLPGSASLKLNSLLKNNKIIKVKSLKEALEKAKKIAKRGEVVLFSPASASFNLFKNEVERGEKFKEEVWKLK